MGETFDVGDVVALRDDVASGPMRRMTVEEVDRPPGHPAIVTCVWFVESSLRRGRFTEECLRGAAEVTK